MGAFLTLEPEFANILPLKELLDLLALELFEVEDRETIDRLDAILLGELLRVTLELLLVEGLVVLTLELMLVEGLEVLTLELLLVEGLEVLTLELLLVEGLEILTLELLLVEGLEVLTLELEDLEELEALEGAELFETDRLLPLDLLLLERVVLAITGTASKIKAKAIENRIVLRFFECFRVYMVFLLFELILSDLCKTKIYF